MSKKGKRTLIIIIAVLLILGLAYFLYKKYKKKEISAGNGAIESGTDIVNDGSSTTIVQEDETAAISGITIDTGDLIPDAISGITIDTGDLIPDVTPTLVPA